MTDENNETRPTRRVPPDNEQSSLIKSMTISSFVMLSMLTWATSPLQKLVENVQHKETIKAQLKVCAEVRSMLDVYADWTTTLFESGCLWEVRNILLAFGPEKERDNIKKEFLEEKGSVFESTMNRCKQGSAQAMKEFKIVDRVATPIYFEKFNCPKIIEEAEKLGIDLPNKEVIK